MHKVIAIDEAQNCWVKRLIQKTHTQFSFCHRATYIDPIGLPKLVSQTPQKMVTPPAPSRVCFPSNDQRQHTLQKNEFASSDPHHDMLGGGCQVRVVIENMMGRMENLRTLISGFLGLVILVKWALVTMFLS